MLGLILLLVFKVCSSTNVEAISGSTTTLTCPLQWSSFQWKKSLVNSAWSTLQEGDKYGNVNTTSLVIYNVDPGDDGSYLCSNGSQTSYIQVTVIVIAIEGSTTTLTCPLQGSSFKWLKGSNSSSSILQQDAKYGIVNNRSLDIYNVDPYDGGTYFCENDTQQLQMNIVFRAIATWGSNTTLTCTLNGSYYDWQKRTDSGWMNLTQAETKYGNVNSGNMTIYNVQLNDGGRYRCGDNPNLEEVDVIVRVEAISGSNTTLTCPLNGSSFQWEKLLVNSSRSTLQEGDKYGNVNTTSLVIYNIDPGDDGSYLCSNGSQQSYIQVTFIVNGDWGSWGSWTQCTKTCVEGTRTRYRACDNPSPANGGSTCLGLYNETGSCSTSISCPVNGNWGTWQDWNSCSVTCGGGSRARYRECNYPEPAHGGLICQGNDTEIDSCSIKLCPVNGDWGSWGSWTQCTKTCVGGTRTRYRACDNPSPVNGGSPCPGLDNETTSCSTTISCRAVNGNWGTWQDWNSCSATCGSGSRSRYQECNNPEPAHGGSSCQGNDTEINSCSIKLCPVKSEGENSSATIGIGAGIGSAAVVVGLLIVFIYILKRYRLRRPAESPIYSTTVDTGSSNSDLHIYDGLQQNTESPTHRQNDVTYVNAII